MRQTRDGHLLVELSKGGKSETVVGKLGATISANLGDNIEGVSKLGQLTEVEIVVIYAAVNKYEPEGENDPVSN